MRHGLRFRGLWCSRDYKVNSKEAMKYFIFSLVLIALSYALTASALDANCLAKGGVLNGWMQGVHCANDASGLENTKIKNIINAIMLWIITLVGILSIIAFAIAGILYLTAAGDEDQIGRAKKMVRYAIIGTIVALSGLIIIKGVSAALEGKDNF